MSQPDRLGLIRPLVEHLEVREVESRPYCAPDQRVRPGRASGLPATRPDHVDGPPAVVNAPEHVPGDFAEARISAPQLERIALVVVPRLVGRDTVPAADLAGDEEKVDGRQRRSRAAVVGGLNGGLGPVNLTEAAALRVGHQSESFDEQ